MSDKKALRNLLESQLAEIGLKPGDLPLTEEVGPARKPEALDEMKGTMGTKLRKFGSKVRIQKLKRKRYYKRNRAILQRKHARWAKTASGKRYARFVKKHAGLISRLHRQGRRLATAESTNVAALVQRGLTESAGSDTRTVLSTYALEAFASGAAVVGRLVRRYAGMGDEEACEALMDLGEKFHEHFEAVEAGGDAVLTEEFQAKNKAEFKTLRDVYGSYRDEHMAVEEDCILGF